MKYFSTSFVLMLGVVVTNSCSNSTFSSTPNKSVANKTINSKSTKPTDHSDSQPEPGLITNLFRGSDLGILDIVLVVDNSPSMFDNRAKLSSKLSVLLGEIENSNWKIGVISTDPKNLSFSGIIKKPTYTQDEKANENTRAEVNKSFSDAVLPSGVGGLLSFGSGKEKGILQAVNGLKTPGFLRNESTIAVIIVSDEDNCSDGSDCPGAAYQKADYLLNYLKNDLKRPLGTMSKVFGLIWVPGDTSCSKLFGGQNEGIIYKTAVEATQGKMGSICAGDYSDTLSGISSLLQIMLQSQWELTQLPALASVNVYVNEVRLAANEYSISGKILKLKTAPAASASIKVTYLNID